MTGNSIDFQVDNRQLNFDLVGDKTWADWGDFRGDAVNVPARQMCSGAKVHSSHGLFTGSAGIIGYEVTSGDETIHLRLAASNPYMSAESNTTMVKIDTEWQGYEAEYNEMYNNMSNEASQDFAGKTFKITSNIGSADDATATFIMTWE